MLNVLQRTGQSPLGQDYLASVSVMLKLRVAVMEGNILGTVSAYLTMLPQLVEGSIVQVFELTLENVY